MLTECSVAMLILDQQYYYDVHKTQHRDIRLRSCNHIYCPLVAIKTNSSYMHYIAHRHFIISLARKWRNAFTKMSNHSSKVVIMKLLKKNKKPFCKYKHFFKHVYHQSLITERLTFKLTESAILSNIGVNRPQGYCSVASCCFLQYRTVNTLFSI